MPSRKIAKPKLSKYLKEPIEIEEIRRPSILSDIDDSDAWFAKQRGNQLLFVATERLNKLQALAEHYKLAMTDHNNHLLLCLKIAEDFIGGFQIVVKKPRGKPRIWNNIILYMLWYEIEQKINLPRYSGRAACRDLANKEPWCSLLQTNGENSQKSLYEWYGKAKNSHLVMFFRKKEIGDESLKEFYDILKTNFEAQLDKNPTKL